MGPRRDRRRRPAGPPARGAATHAAAEQLAQPVRNASRLGRAGAAVTERTDATVAIPTRDGGELLVRTLRALARQTVEHELLVCDSGSTDGTLQAARAHGARVLEIATAQFSHGGTRNLLMREAAGARVALLTQDA